MKAIFVLLLSCVLSVTVHAAKPLWTIEPAAGSNPTQTVAENETVNIQYQVQNQSRKSKKLVLYAIPGITQVNSCIIAPRGHVGSSCILNLNINGSALPAEGVHGGPFICQEKADGSPNKNQCYQPSTANSLNITRGATSNAVISVSPSSLSFISGGTGNVTVSNSTSSAVPATSISALIPNDSSISIQSTTCGASLAIGASCIIHFTASASEGPTLIDISGSNTNSTQVAVTVTPVAAATISVSPTVLQFTKGATGTLTVTNSSLSPVAATGVNLTSASEHISVQSTTCTESLEVGSSCVFVLTGTEVEGPIPVSINGGNTNTATANVTVTAPPVALLSVSPAVLQFTQNTTGTLTVTNSSLSPVAAADVNLTILFGNISVQSTTCTGSLDIGSSCVFILTSTDVGVAQVSVSGGNTNMVTADVNVTATPEASLSVNPTLLQFTQNTTGTLTVTNSSLSPVAAANVNLMVLFGNISVQSTTCTGSLDIGSSCAFILTSTDVGVAQVSVSGDNTNMVTADVNVTATPEASLSVNPTVLQFTQNTTGTLTVTNSSLSPVAAANVNLSILFGNISVQSTTCTSSLDIGSSCAFILTSTDVGTAQVSVSGGNTNMVTADVNVTATPVASLSVNPTVLQFAQNTTGILTVTNSSLSPVDAAGVSLMSTSEHISVQSTTCTNNLPIGSSCDFVLTGTEVEGPIPVSISGSNTNTATADVTVTATPNALLSVNPSSLTFNPNGTGSVIVTNSIGSPVAAEQVMSFPPEGSHIVESSNNCGVSLGIGETCSISYTSTDIEGPTNITVKGTNTTEETVIVNVVPVPTTTISVSPDTLTFSAGNTGIVTVTNSGAVPATGITAGIPSGSTIHVQSTDCSTLNPGNSCSIILTSNVSAMSTITINGTNTNTQTVEVTVDVACIPITVNSMPGVSIAQQLNVTNGGAVIDSDLNNSATLSLMNGVQGRVVLQLPGTIPASTTVQYGVKTAGGATLSTANLYLYKSGGQISSQLIAVGSLITFTGSASDFDGIGVEFTGGIVLSPLNLYYFCVGQ